MYNRCAVTTTRGTWDRCVPFIFKQWARTQELRDVGHRVRILSPLRLPISPPRHWYTVRYHGILPQKPELICALIRAHFIHH